jgi:hypothetical protein
MRKILKVSIVRELTCSNCNHPVWLSRNCGYKNGKWQQLGRTCYHDNGELGVTPECRTKGCTCIKPRKNKCGSK